MAYTREQKREYQRIWLAERRANWFVDKKCVVCGTTDSLELDHIDPTKKVSHKIWSWSEERRSIETQKCQVLCNKHHKEKTKAYWLSIRTHGRGLYKHGCRCMVCYDAQKAHNAQRNLPH